MGFHVFLEVDPPHGSIVFEIHLDKIKTAQGRIYLDHVLAVKGIRLDQLEAVFRQGPDVNLLIFDLIEFRVVHEPDIAVLALVVVHAFRTAATGLIFFFVIGLADLDGAAGRRTAVIALAAVDIRGAGGVVATCGQESQKQDEYG